MTRPVNMTHPIRCSQCGKKFIRTRGNQRRCVKCMPTIVVLKRMLRAGEQKRKYDLHNDHPILFPRGADSSYVPCECGGYRPA